MLISTVQFIARMSRETQDKIWLVLCDEYTENFIWYRRGLISNEECTRRQALVIEMLEIISELQLA
jgi:hypothetical protein